MTTRFIKPKIDKYIQLYSEYAKNEGVLYSSIRTITITNPGTVFYFTEPVLSLSSPPTGGIRATATCTIENGVPNTVTITNPGFGYTAAAVITISGGGGGAGTVPTIVTTVNLDRKREFEWDLESPIELNENALIQIVEREYINASSTTIYAIRILDLASQSIVNTTDGSSIPGQIRLTRGKMLDIGIPNKTYISDIKLEIQPQIISKIVLLIDDGISRNFGILGNIEFFISLKITEQEPKFLEFGSLNNININQ